MFDSALLSDDNTDSMIPKEPVSSIWGDSQTIVAELGCSEVKIETPFRDTAWIRYAIEELDRIADLRANWDSYGAQPVDQRTLEHALSVYLELVERRAAIDIPQISATVAGGVELLWHRGQKGLEVEITAPLQVHSYFYDEETEEDNSQEVGIDLETVNQRLDQVLE